MRILIVSLKTRTEALWSAALASAMKRLLPKVRVDFLTLQANQETIEGIDAVDRVLALALFGPSLPSSWGPVPIRGPRQWSDDEALERRERIVVARCGKFLDCDACDGARS